MILLQVGQCGIQAGQSLINQFQEQNQLAFPQFPFSLYKQLIIDTERKVWRNRQQQGDTLFEATYYDHGSQGRGNNWAHGYYDESNTLEIMNTYRRLVESQHQYDGCMLIHSLAGGTGSGLGSKLVQEIRDQYGKNYIMTSSFAPFVSGDTAVQNYNSILSLQVLQENADYIGFFANDELMKCVARNGDYHQSQNLSSWHY